MVIQAAEESFQQGLVALAAGRRKEATALFEAAITVERRLGSPRSQARYLSYYGLCLGLEFEQHRKALDFCGEAARLESYNADVQCNLGRVQFAAGKRREAHETLRRGLRQHPGHASLIRQLKLMGVRRRPVLPFLGRQHPLNVFLGRLRRSGASSDRGAGVRCEPAAAPSLTAG